MDNAVERIRHFIERGDFAAATVLWREWSHDLSGRMRGRTVTPAEWAKTEALYRWSKDALNCARAQALDRLNTLHAAGVYMRGSR